MAAPHPPRLVFGVVGWKNAGKTTLVERLVAELTRRGRRVSTVKHSHHVAEVDQPGRDSFRHREAGAVEVALVGTRRWAVMHELRGAAEPSLAEVLARLAPVDLIIVEGYKREAHPKLEVRRADAARGEPLAPGDASIVAVATDRPERAAAGPPQFHLDDVLAIADFVERTMFGSEGENAAADLAGSSRPG